MNTAIQDINDFRNWYLSSWFYLEEWVKKNPDHKHTFDRIMRAAHFTYKNKKSIRRTGRARKKLPKAPTFLYEATPRYHRREQKRWLAWYKIDWKNPRP